MAPFSPSAKANPNIAFIKYWGNVDSELNLPSSGSISMNLDGLETRTSVRFNSDLKTDTLVLNGASASEGALNRVSKFLDHVRRLAGISTCAAVESTNNFPMGAGIASSASAFAALSLAASTAAGLQLSEKDLSRLARLGSGSACRSIPGGFVEWQAGSSDENSYAYSIAPPDYWNLVDCIAIVEEAHKPTGSSEGHNLAPTSPLQTSRLAGSPARLEACRQAILQRDYEAFARVVELDSNLMHAVMITSRPALLYWQPATISIMQAVQEARQRGLPVCYTIDAGPNVHVLSEANSTSQALDLLGSLNGVERLIVARPGCPARLL